ncbi:MAG: hypothetical protein GW903_01840 [Alphaproteobacteria bacterium]|nr:hypothetical protein [Alphaproteobacteria bacterium]NCQ87712.1 hypothetical protein [Alphaproteobacteria bacterium]NCT05779.1 hypothetical protein [Alphaproteobacteria bacterium]
MKKILTLLAAAMLMSTSAHAEITEAKVLEAQAKWSAGIEHISKTFIEKGDYKKAAEEHIDTLYAYDISKVLFKPTLASTDQFRETKEEALSYFVGGIIPEDKGFAIKPWKKVRWGEQQIIVHGTEAIAMGNYFFTPADSDIETKVEFTFGYMMDENGNLRINAHHSSLPFTPAE